MKYFLFLTSFWNGTFAPAVLDTSSKPLSIEMIAVEGGTFSMGQSDPHIGGKGVSRNEQPVRTIAVKSFSIGKYEVTQAQWKAVMAGKNPSKFSSCDNCPVEQVTWEDVQTFLQALNAQTSQKYRLPTEAEWEYAAIGGKKTKNFKYSGSNTLDEVAWHNENARRKTHEVGGKLPNELGIFDMSGNVWEWCQDWYSFSYSIMDADNPKGATTGDSRIQRGSGWNTLPKTARITFRGYLEPARQGNFIGFRLAHD
jgi:formylglycine-generating enzyme